MSNINNQPQDLFAIDSVQDLSNESAAAVSGGVDVTMWDNTNRTGKKITSNNKVPDLKALNFDNKAGSITVDGKVNKKKWRFYVNPKYNTKGGYFDVAPGKSVSLTGSLAQFNNKISSFQAI
jgi:hypothetical protein